MATANLSPLSFRRKYQRNLAGNAVARDTAEKPFEEPFKSVGYLCDFERAFGILTGMQRLLCPQSIVRENRGDGLRQSCGIVRRNDGPALAFLDRGGSEI